MTAWSRTAQQRVRDTRRRLARDVDCWVATAGSEGGSPYLVPLSFLWYDGALVLATPAESPTGCNLARSRIARIGVGRTRDVVLIEAEVTSVTPASEVDHAVGEAFAAKTGFDPRTLRAAYSYFRAEPRVVQAWREANELAGREIMRAGRWVVDIGPDPGTEAVEGPPYELRPIGWVASRLTDPAGAPKQADEGAPSARVVIDHAYTAGLQDLQPGQEVLLLTWLHLARRDVVQVHPRGDESRPLTGVFATRAPSRPNPIGLHRVTIQSVDADGLTVEPLEAIDGTPVIDVKPLLGPVGER